MKFLNLKSKNVDFNVFDLQVWAKQHEIEISFDLISESKGISVSRVRLWDISTFHRENDVVFYCNDEFVFFEESHNLFGDEVPIVKKLFFSRTKVNEDRIEKLLLGINDLAAGDETALFTKGCNIWKAESCELALAS